MTSTQRVHQRPLGGIGLTIPALAFGAGPVSALMTDAAARGRQLATIQQALALGVDWFDTAATYGNGASETSLGWALRELGLHSAVGRGSCRAGGLAELESAPPDGTDSGSAGASPHPAIRIGTKVRLAEADLSDITGAVRASVEGSLRRLGVNSVALLQLHNSVTHQRGDQPTSISPDDVLCADGVLAAFAQLRREGLVQHFGLTGLGDAESLEVVLRAEAWATMQVNLNLCDSRPAVADARLERAGWTPALLAIRVFAGGALAGRPPSAHTLTTKFFPLAGYERDLRRAETMRSLLPAGISLPEAAVRFAVHHARVTSAIIGFGSPEEVADAARWAANGPLPDELVATLTRAGV